MGERGPLEIRRCLAGVPSARPSRVAYAHDHATVLALPKKQFAFLPVKKALLSRHGLASHWSCTHNGYWSAIRYVCVPSPKKPADTLDIEPVLWAVDGEHPPVETCRDEPMTANGSKRRAEIKYKVAAGAGEHLPTRCTQHFLTASDA